MNKLYYFFPWFLQTLIWIPTRIFFKNIYSYQISGLEYLDDLKKNKRGVIFAANHTSEMDPIMIPASLPFLSFLMPMFYVSRERKFYRNSGWKQRFYGGTFFKLWGAHNAYTGFKNFDVALQHHIQLLFDGKSVCIFPEGKKTKDGNLGEGKAGVAFLSYRTMSPIVPVKINGLYKPFAEKSPDGKTKLEVIFGQPIYPVDLFGTQKNPSIDDLKTASKNVMLKIANLHL